MNSLKKGESAAEHESQSQRREEETSTERGLGSDAAAETEQSAEVRRISDGIAEALRDGSTIDHETAWLLARQISPGSGALHDLARTGEIGPDIGADLETAYQVLPAVADTWIAALDGYCWRRRDKGPVPGWPREPEDVESET
jgi:hypothetical protein